MASIITLTTDYGTRDTFVAGVKGVILGINPQTLIVDITHEVAPQDLWEGAFTLKTAYSSFPRGTVHLAVVDPGVGSGRRPIIAVTESYYFVGPDNGLFSMVYAEAERLRVHHITAAHYFQPNPGPTFHGRDIFAPVAAWLARGIPSRNFGEEIEDFVRLTIPAPTRSGESVDGQVAHIDRFGNVITNLTFDDVRSLKPEGELNDISLAVGGRTVTGIRNYYAEAKSGEPGLIINSSGHLEVFLYQQNARAALNVKRGDAVRLTRKA